jgi:hypothetical protein
MLRRKPLSTVLTDSTLFSSEFENVVLVFCMTLALNGVAIVIRYRIRKGLKW